MDLIEVTERALATGPLCDSCLGRLVADRSFGLTNAERGRAMRTAHALTVDDPFEEPDEQCWVCEGECERFGTFADRAVAALEPWAFDTYQVGTRVSPLLEENEQFLREDAGVEEESDERVETLNNEFNREVGKRIGEATGTEVDLERPDVLVLIDLSTDELEVQVNSAFVYGRYRKLDRDIPQTRWPCTDCNQTGIKRGEECEACMGTGFRYGTSVEQLTAPPVVEAMDGSEATFHGAGREDVDALMLGPGRPFVIEVKQPRTRDVDVEELEREVNAFADGRAEVEGLRLATHEMVERVKKLDASKTYRARVEFDAPVDEAALATAVEELRGTTVEQRTPHRVDARRADLVRTRTVYDVAAELEDDHHATVEVHGEGGLYIKELVSSDEGRTEPSLAGLLDVGAVVTALDVLSVEGEDEPFERPEFFRETAN
ncbi:tRNA pseudouridine(54/55) synthase Pus10 [Halomarina oriensis]|uniref:tRNA pseudouridine synthase Pus10 n=1 Tax=Halomarina oriensis TaxID=671145 RepID=A0A6B0GPM9_9EURY|nr:tRNA pseudouridine(54/55) synthase Pus10 [Halomarina oriensis]MWG36794.1 tRNA pseudouridine(54/55) synthase Pus10 [Halomarina oriensis]